MEIGRGENDMTVLSTADVSAVGDGLQGDPRDVRPEHALLYPIADAAALLGISRSNLYCLMRAGEVRSVRIGSRRLIPRTALESFVDTLPEAS